MLDREAGKLLLSLVDQECPALVGIDKAPLERGIIKQMVRLAKANGLFYCLANRLVELGIDLSFMREALLQEERRRQAYLKTILLLNNIETDSGLKYILIKDCASLPNVPRDIDVFISPANKERFCQILRASGMKCVYDSTAETSYTREGYMELDIYTSIIYGGKTFFDEEFLWRARAIEQKDSIKYPALQPYANYPLILVHSLMGHRVMSLLDFLHLQSIKKKIALGPSQEYAYKMGWGEVFDIAVGELAKMERRLYSEDMAISFPYLFERSFVLRCFSSLGGIGQNSTFRASASLKLSLLIDRLVHELRKSPFYEPLEKLKFPGRVATRLGLVVRCLRGDRKA